jgi:hypothetical protein
MPRNSACPESLFFLWLQTPILAGLSRETVGKQVAMARSHLRKISDELKGPSNHRPVFTDVDLLLLDQTSYLGRCVCSGLFYAWDLPGFFLLDYPKVTTVFCTQRKCRNE